MAGFEQVQETGEGTKSAADRLIESVKLTVVRWSIEPIRYATPPAAQAGD
jgi:hypothetical protein